jgi:hypothetical protein
VESGIINVEDSQEDLILNGIPELLVNPDDVNLLGENVR